jgi:hypothetical protein
LSVIKVCGAALLAVVLSWEAAGAADLAFLNRDHPVLDAHNCYPYDGRWNDRVRRALDAGFPVSIEQDLAWYVDPKTGKGRVVVSHTPTPTGHEPTLRAYFFEQVRPVIEKALAGNPHRGWPLIILHFDFKSLQPELLRAVWHLLGEYESWITTAPQTSDPHQLAPFDPKPLLALTEDADAQEVVFFRSLSPDVRLRIFGSAHTSGMAGATNEERIHLAATLPPERLLTKRPTNYRRWWNNSWFEVEEGGQSKAGDWSTAGARRLQALVDHAHQLGYWIRFYTLDGFAPSEDQGWGNGYNFGSRSAAQARWKAALQAGVDLIATDQYEDFARFLSASTPAR